MLKFKNPKKELPQKDDRVLIKYHIEHHAQPGGKFPDEEGYYECYVEKGRDGTIIFIESQGEGYYGFTLREVVGWLPIEDLNKIQIEED